MEVEEPVRVEPGEFSTKPEEDLTDAVEASAPSAVRPEALHLHGVEELNTQDIESFMQQYYSMPFRIEWIDDSGLNIVYDDPEDAFQALVALTDDSEFSTDAAIPPEQLRKAKPHPNKSDVELQVRFALSTDKKASGSRARSRYYLLHGEPDRREDIVRFGTQRSQPQLYGLGKRDLVKKSRRQDRAGDLFPMKDESRIALDSDMMDDLLPHKAGKRRRRGGRGRGRRGKSSEPDLFADKAKTLGDKGPRKATDDHKDEHSAPGSGIYQNMDY